MDGNTIFLTLSAIVLATYYFLKRRYSVFKEHGIPYERPVPFLGNFWRVLLGQLSFNEWTQHMYNLHPDAKYVGLYDMTKPIFVIRDPELVKSISVKNFDYFTDHNTFADENVEPLFGKNLIALRGDRWREIRTTLSPAFTSSKLRGMYKLMFECAAYYGDYVAGLTEGNNVLDLQDVFTRYTNDVIATCAFGIKIDSLKDRGNKFYVYGREATNFGIITSLKFFMTRNLPFLMKLFHIRFIKKEIAQFFENIIRNTVRTREEKAIVRPDMIQLMMEMRGKLESGRDITLEDMTANAFIFFFGGFESTSTTMCFTAHEIAVNPDVQKRLKEEIDGVLEESNGEVTYEQINNMKYFEAVVNEALRMYPVGVVSDRTSVKDFELPAALPGLKPFKLKAGTDIWIPIHGLHYDPKYFEEPTKFNPDRFLLDPRKYLNSGVFIPFGMGPRMCIGNRFALLEIKALLFHILARCELKPCSKTMMPMKLSKGGISLRPINGFWLKFEPRKNIHPSLLRKAAYHSEA